MVSTHSLPSLSAPTASADWRRMGRAVRDALTEPRWLLVAALATLATVALFLATTKGTYLRTVVIGGDLSAAGRLRALWSVTPLFGSDARPLRDAVLWLTAAAVGTNLAVVAAALSRDALATQGSAGSVLAVGVGTLGAGCASCWLAVLASALSASGAAAALVALPLDGVEFLLVALALVVLSVHWIAEQRYGAGAACEIE